MTSRNTIIGAEAVRLSDLLHRGRFSVPWHQRYYDWKESDVRALMQDLNEAVTTNRDCYFLGAIMLIKGTPGRWEINDGQQRMVTMSLICAAFCRHFASCQKDPQREALALRILFDIDINSPCALGEAEHYPPRIAPPENDRVRYRQMIRGHSIGTNGRLTSAWKEIEKFLAPMDTNQLSRLFDFILKNLEVACLEVPGHVDPNAVYETLNCRGKTLDHFDLIRNNLYSYFNVSGERERRQTLHENLERIRVVIPAPTKASEYLRCHLQCRFGFLRKDNLYRDVRKAIQNWAESSSRSATTESDKVFSLTEEITSGTYLYLYNTITAKTPDPDFVNNFKQSSGSVNHNRTISVYLRELHAYKVTQPLIFALLSWYVREHDGRKKKRIAKIVHKNLGRLATFVLRTAFVAPKFEPSHFETEFSTYAHKIMSADDIPNDDFLLFLKQCDSTNYGYGVLDNTKFQHAMSGATMKGTAKIRSFLLGINTTFGRDSRILNPAECSVEHILPQSHKYWANWGGFPKTEHDEWVHKIGNLTLMGTSDNKPGTKFNDSFEAKQEFYAQSSIALTRELSEIEEWTPEAITRRQKKMIRRAVQVWDIF